MLADSTNITFLNSFSDDSDYTEASNVLGNPIENALMSVSNTEFANKQLGKAGKKEKGHFGSTNEEKISRLRFNPFLKIEEGCDGVKAVADLVDGHKSGFEMNASDAAGNELLKSGQFYRAIPLTPLNCCDIMFEDAINPLQESRYWKVMRKKIAYRLSVRAGLVEHEDFEFVGNGLMNILIFKNRPKKVTIDNMLFPEGIEDFKKTVERAYNNGSGEINFVVVNAAVSEYPNEPVKKKSEYSDISVKPIMVDISYLNSEFVNEELPSKDRAKFIDDFITGLFYSITIEHRVVTFKLDSIEDSLRRMMCDIAFNRDYNDEDHLEPLYITDDTLGEGEDDEAEPEGDDEDED